MQHKAALHSENDMGEPFRIRTNLIGRSSCKRSQGSRIQGDKLGMRKQPVKLVWQMKLANPRFGHQQFHPLSTTAQARAAITHSIGLNRKARVIPGGQSE